MESVPVASTSLTETRIDPVDITNFSIYPLRIFVKANAKSRLNDWVCYSKKTFEPTDLGLRYILDLMSLSGLLPVAAPVRTYQKFLHSPSLHSYQKSDCRYLVYNLIFIAYHDIFTKIYFNFFL